MKDLKEAKANAWALIPRPFSGDKKGFKNGWMRGFDVGVATERARMEKILKNEYFTDEKWTELFPVNKEGAE